MRIFVSLLSLLGIGSMFVGWRGIKFFGHNWAPGASVNVSFPLIVPNLLP